MKAAAPAAAKAGGSHEETNADILAARQRMMAKMGNATKIGGAGTQRRKQKAKHTSVVTDDKKLQGQMKRLGCNPIPGIEEVNMFTEDGKCLHFEAPKLQASLQANTYVVSGSHEKKELQDMISANPSIVSQLGSDNMGTLKNLATKAGKENADDDIPDVAEDFEEISKVD